MEDEEDTTSVKPRVNMNEAVYQEAKELYELGKLKLSELPARFGFSKQAFHRRFAKEGIVAGSRAHEIAAAVKKSITEDVEVANRFSARRGQWIEETRMTGHKALQLVRQIGGKMVADTLRAGGTIKTLDDDFKALNRWGKILNENLAADLLLLGAEDFTDSQDLPSLTIEDLTVEDILEHHKRTGAFPDDMTVEEMLAEERGEPE